MSGTNAGIGRALAELAMSRHGVRAEDMIGDGRYVRARRSYFQRTYPIHFERMRGVATAFDLRADDDRFDFSVLRRRRNGGAPPSLAGVSSYSPPSPEGDVGSLLLRDAVLPQPSTEPLELYLMDWRPSAAAHRSVAVHIDDLLSGAIVGINEAGVVVSAVAADAAARDRRGRSANLNAVGLHELGLMRLLLDACRTVDDAQAAVLAAQVFPLTAPARYLVADADGRSFVYESSVDHRSQRIIDGGGDGQVISSWHGRRLVAEWGWRCVVDQARRTVEVTIGQADGRSTARPASKQGGEAADLAAAGTVRVSAAI